MLQAMQLIAVLTTPVNLLGWQRMLLLIPLCASISIVYKTIRYDDLRQVPAAAAVLCITIVAGMYAVGVGAWLLFLLLA